MSKLVPDLIVTDHRVESSQAGLSVFVRNKHLADRDAFTTAETVLFVHGATYPSTITFDYAIDGVSWMDIMARAGFDVWCVDLLGYGNSDRPAEMSVPADDNPPVVDTDDAVADVTRVIDFILGQRDLPRLSLIGYSWGTLIGGTYAGQQPDKIERLVLYGAAWMGTGGAISTGKPPGAYRMVDAEAAIARWCRELDDSQIASIASPDHRTAWANAFLASDPEASRHRPPQARAPAGVVKDVQARLLGDTPPYDPSLIQAPTMIIVGDWDRETRPEQGKALFDLLSNTAERRYVLIGGGTHSLLIENQRGGLHRTVDGFLKEGWLA
ncbi:MAG: alpha/beta hydrolase [Alphaproteobacteria bacterium]|nr:alpha/beta hydrolase [Alphaproteobacteria bacterium]